MTYFQKLKDWLFDTGIRVLKTAAETAIASIGASALFSEVNWTVVGSAVALSAIVTILMNVSSLPSREDKAADGE